MSASNNLTIWVIMLVMIIGLVGIIPDSPLRALAALVVFGAGITAIFLVALQKTKNATRQKIAILSEDIQTTPNNQKMYVERGILYNEIAKYQEALRDFKAALAIDTNYTEAYIARGNTLSLQKRYREAVADYNHALTITEDEHLIYLAYYNRGYAYYHMEENALALPDLLRAHETNPEEPLACLYLGNIYDAQAQYDEALSFFKEYLELADKRAYPSPIPKVRARIRQIEKRQRA